VTEVKSRHELIIERREWSSRFCDRTDLPRRPFRFHEPVVPGQGIKPDLCPCVGCISGQWVRRHCPIMLQAQIRIFSILCCTSR